MKMNHEGTKTRRRREENLTFVFLPAFVPSW